ncbi:hypothetical protein H4CHR_01945 [Variovorax sp. PBS-H4]|uniref:hypothetical protein n=1 Tax=Variovorax sp. PBS-H4 TaxID=434008 RepID=UPI001317C705|nr:hypothetical protein [Variovorax sp. PBS-H4]VTU27194.1 hypothetical protein H4CHR_01945 [Variovorax sp. PBS-H4]
MTRRPRQVDLGPLYLPVGEDTGFATERTGLADDADRFAALLDVAPRSASDRLAHSAGPSDDGASASDLADHVQSMWERDTEGDDTEVRVIPGRDVAPHTTLRLQVRSGMLQVDIHCDGSANPAWFIPRLPSLARDLAARLQRPIGVALFGPDKSRIGHFEASEGGA